MVRDKEFYNRLIQNKETACSGTEQVIQKYTTTDAGFVLAVIGLEHPASASVFEYLMNEKLGIQPVVYGIPNETIKTYLEKTAPVTGLEAALLNELKRTSGMVKNSRVAQYKKEVRSFLQKMYQFHRPR